MKEVLKKNIELFGNKIQQKISHTHVVIVGCGGTGCMTLSNLLRLGVQSYTLIDFDIVSISNLNRQLFYTKDDIGKKKVNILKEKTSNYFDVKELKIYDERLESDNFSKLVDGRFIFDCTDNLETKFVLSRAISHSYQKVLFHSGVNRYNGQVMTITSNTACLDCFMKKPEKEDLKTNIIMPVAMASSLQTMLFLDFLEDFAQKDNLIFFDLKNNFSIDNVHINKNLKCTYCGGNK